MVAAISRRVETEHRIWPRLPMLDDWQDEALGHPSPQPRTSPTVVRPTEKTSDRLNGYVIRQRVRRSRQGRADVYGRPTNRQGQTTVTVSSEPSRSDLSSIHTYETKRS